jgi:hypothetical protein
MADIDNYPYPIRELTNVKRGLLKCDDCRQRDYCFNVHPFVFPDIEHKCGANFIFEGETFYYIVNDKREKL